MSSETLQTPRTAEIIVRDSRQRATIAPNGNMDCRCREFASFAGVFHPSCT